jgi:GNAT superfamily N-acetyltransferase
MQPTIDHVGLSIRQFIDAWRVLCSASPSHSSHTADGVACEFSGVPIGFFNAAVLTGRAISTGELAAHAETARAWASGRAVPWLLVVTIESLQPATDYSAALDACGFAPLMPLTGMLARDVASVDRLPDGLELQIPNDDAGCTALLDVNSAAYGMQLEAGNDVWGKAAFWKDHVPVLGLVEGQPVCTTAVMNVAGYRYVALVATAPDRQRRGYADAAMRHALELARARYGNLPTFLHATEAGRPVYERMGYDIVARHMIFMDKSFLSQH